MYHKLLCDYFIELIIQSTLLPVEESGGRKRERREVKMIDDRETRTFMIPSSAYDRDVRNATSGSGGIRVRERKGGRLLVTGGCFRGKEVYENDDDDDNAKLKMRLEANECERR